jgi:N4-(beta-N-acetylglucosaminyl)-L-asparaginase
MVGSGRISVSARVASAWADTEMCPDPVDYRPMSARSIALAGDDVLDALIAGVNIPELDPDGHERRVRRPAERRRRRAAGRVLHARPEEARRRGRALEGVRTPSPWRRLVMDHTDHHLLVGRARRLRAADGLHHRGRPEHRSRGASGWSGSVASIRRAGWTRSGVPRPRSRGAAEMLRGRPDRCRAQLLGHHQLQRHQPKGDICGVTTTSGLAWKIPGRVGDSPILGAGLYVDNDVGAAGSTGRGEANLYNLCSFLIVENMRRGMSPKDAGIQANTWRSGCSTRKGIRTST